jgi:hypothetical protein
MEDLRTSPLVGFLTVEYDFRGGQVALTRRRFIVGSAAAAAAAAGGIAVMEGTPAAGALVLTQRELAIVTALAEVMFPGDPFPLDGVAAGVPFEVDRIVARVLEPIHGSGFRVLLHTLEWGTLGSRGKPFTALPHEVRAEVLERWLAPDLFTRRLAADAFRVVLGMAYFAHPKVLAHIGWRANCGGGAS